MPVVTMASTPKAMKVSTQVASRTSASTMRWQARAMKPNRQVRQVATARVMMMVVMVVISFLLMALVYHNRESLSSVFDNFFATFFTPWAPPWQTRRAMSHIAPPERSPCAHPSTHHLSVGACLACSSPVPCDAPLCLGASHVVCALLCCCPLLVMPGSRLGLVGPHHPVGTAHHATEALVHLGVRHHLVVVVDHLPLVLERLFVGLRHRFALLSLLICL